MRPAKTVVVQTAGQTFQRSFTGVVQAQDQVDMAFRVTGPLVQLPVKAGDTVKAGDLLAQIDPRDFRSRVAKISGSLDQARAQLTAMKAGAREEDIRILKNKVSAAQSEFDNAQVEEKRYKNLLDGGTHHGLVCRFCTVRETCVGVTLDHLQAWRTRGMMPVM